MASEPMIAIGRSLPGFFVSSPEVETASNPMYAKKITDAAVTVPSRPFGANGCRLPESNAVTPSTRNSASTASLMNTMIVLVRALSRMPTQSTAVTASTMKTAGRLNEPPSPGGAASEPGSVKPNSGAARSWKYWPQPPATAATDTAYSRIGSQPMIHAAISPSVAYEYV